MRKSSLVKAMACFMAATMAVTFVPSANVTNGVSVVAQAAETESALEPTFKLDFESELPEGCKIEGAGSIEETDDADHNKVFHNAGGQVRTNYLVLPENTLVDAIKVKGELTISMDVNVGDAEGYFYAPLFSAYAQKNATNGMPMMVIQSRGLTQVNCNGWTDFTNAENVAGVNTESTVYLDDKEWHKVTVTFTKEKAVYYIDGKVVNEWNIDSTTDNKGGLNGFLTEEGASQLKYVCLGGNQAWDWNDNDASYLFDNFEVYSSALTSTQVRELSGVNPAAKVEFTNKDGETVALNTPFDLTVKVTGQEEGKAVTDQVTASAIGAKVEVSKEFDGSEYVLKVTPTTEGQGSVIVSCGSIDVNGVITSEVDNTYHFNTVSNYCAKLESTKGSVLQDDGAYAFTATAGQYTSFGIKAVAANSKTELPEDNREIKAISSAVINGNEVNASDIAVIDKQENRAGESEATFIVNVAEGVNTYLFECDGQYALVKITGVKSGSTVATTTPSDTTTTPSDTTTTTDSAVTDTPADDTTTPSDSTDATAPSDTTTTTPSDTTTTTPSDTTTTTTPSDTTTTPSDTTTTTTPSDTTTTTTTTKKNAKITSVTAKKGTKVVSGKVTKKATVKVTVNGKTVKTTASSAGKFSVKVAKKLTKGTKVKVVVTKNGYKKATKTVTVK
jgi:hypothetical protein